MINVKQILDFMSEKNKNVNYSGDFSFNVEGYCSINNIQDHCITWIKNNTDENLELVRGKDVLVVCNVFENGNAGIEGNFLTCDYPKEIFFEILKKFFSREKEAEISPHAIIESENIGENCTIGSGTYIGPDVVLGKNVQIANNVTILNKVIIGDHSAVHSGTVIGTDGFGYYKNEQGISEKVPHFGGVRIGCNVEIGANACIDRGTLDDTIIEDDVKIDNLCHIAHNVVIEKASKIIALTLLGGSVHVGEECYVAPGCMIKNQISLGARSVIGMGAMVLKDVSEEDVMVGYPAKVIRKITEADRKM